MDMNYVQQGWQCPICKRVYAPYISMCTFCGDNMEITTYTNTTGEDKSYHVTDAERAFAKQIGYNT